MLVDDEDRENEGDLVVAAQFASTEAVILSWSGSSSVRQEMVLRIIIGGSAGLMIASALPLRAAKR